MEGVSKEEAQAKYVERLLEARLLLRSAYDKLIRETPQILKRTDDEVSKKYVAEIEAA